MHRYAKLTLLVLAIAAAGTSDYATTVGMEDDISPAWPDRTLKRSRSGPETSCNHSTRHFSSGSTHPGNPPRWRDGGGFPCRAAHLRDSTLIGIGQRGRAQCLAAIL
jgi:hypothetical protein